MRIGLESLTLVLFFILFGCAYNQNYIVEPAPKKSQPIKAIEVDANFSIIEVKVPKNTDVATKYTTGENIKRNGWVHVAYDINKKGHTENIRIIDESPKTIYSQQAIHAIKLTRYSQPRLNGELVRINNVSMLYEFNHHPLFYVKCYSPIIYNNHDLVPVYVPEPRYPIAAQRVGKAGYALVEVTVTEEGGTRAEKLLEEGPEGYGFGLSSLSAAKNLRYTPRMVDGVAVEVPGVLYKFTYEIALGYGYSRSKKYIVASLGGCSKHSILKK